MKPLERLRDSNTKRNLWIYILSLLQKREIYGWEMPKLINERFGFKPGKITPYRVLYRLEKEEFVKSEARDRRKFYRITAKGKKELEKAKEFYSGTLNKL
jgi:DNA-binding PadR family transcriptional regulator